MDASPKVLDCNYTFNNDERIIIELNDSSIYEGEFLNSTFNRIDIHNVVTLPKTDFCTEIQNELSFYRNEIVSIRRFKTTTSLCQLLNHHVHKIIPMFYDDFHKSLSRAMQYTYFNQVDARYSRSILHIRSKKTLGVVGLGMEKEGKIPINYIVISSTTETFIYDIFGLEKCGFPIELKEILESPKIQKVIHNCSVVADHLRKCHKIEMVNVFDTAVADLLVNKHKTSTILEKWRTLSECLADYYRFPYTLVEDESLNLDWEEQPLDEFCRQRAALLVGYLLMLKENLEGMMLKQFNNAVDLYANALIKH